MQRGVIVDRAQVFYVMYLIVVHALQMHKYGLLFLKSTNQPYIDIEFLIDITN